MKFLCVKCNEQMLLQEANSHAEINSLSVVYGCGSCGAQTAMLTNPLETQLVKSLGVNIGPDGEQSKKESKCPLTKMLNESAQPADEEISSRDKSAPIENGSNCVWSKEAINRLENIPEFVRPMAKIGIEEFAKGRGYKQISVDVLDEARDVFGF